MHRRKVQGDECFAPVASTIIASTITGVFTMCARVVSRPGLSGEARKARGTMMSRVFVERD